MEDGNVISFPSSDESSSSSSSSFFSAQFSIESIHLTDAFTPKTLFPSLVTSPHPPSSSSSSSLPFVLLSLHIHWKKVMYGNLISSISSEKEGKFNEVEIWGRIRPFVLLTHLLIS